MSRGPENNFIAAVHKLLPRDLYRMKNHNQFNAGIADCWYSGAKSDMWVEYKFIVVPKRDETEVKFGFSPLQIDWLTKRYDEGRVVMAVIGSEIGGAVLSGGNIAASMTARQYRARLQTKKEIAAYITSITGGPM